jgi:hypothetical protein
MDQFEKNTSHFNSTVGDSTRQTDTWTNRWNDRERVG